jgi:two-component system chemotaxis response regulator CheB
MIRVLIVDDSKVIQEFLYHILTSDPEIQVIGTANSGEEALQMVVMTEPDVITMDIHMPGMDGYESTRKIMEKLPTPIVIVSGSPTIKDEVNIFRSLEAGAMAIVHRPSGLQAPDYESSRDELIQSVKNMSQIRITKLFPSARMAKTEESSFELPLDDYLKKIEIVAIGGSTGGQMALQKILSGLPDKLPVPVLIVQKIAAGFTRVFMEWLSITSGIKLKLAVHDETVLPGVGYIAPDHTYMEISKTRRIILSRIPLGAEFTTSINLLFNSVANFYGGEAFGVLLSGQGRDGASGLKKMKNRGAITMVQNESSSIVFEMPGEAVRIGASDLLLSPEVIAGVLAKTGKKW